MKLIKRIKESWITRNNAVALEKLLEKQREDYPGDPYKKRRENARKHLEDRKIHEPKRLRNCDE